MVSYKSRELSSTEFMGERVDFVASNDRIRERVRNISHETHILQTLIERSRADDVFWDVGACLGIHTFVLAKHLPYGEVKAFEPMPSNRGVLADNRSVNEISNVEVFREALADTTESREFAIRESVRAGYGRHSFATGDYDTVKTIPVKVVTGDELVSDGVSPPNIIKIDVEGAGPLVLEGLQQVLRSDECHTVIVETHEPNSVQPSHEDYGYSETDYLDLLRDAGFTVDSLETDYHFIGKKTVEHTQSLNADVSVTICQGDIAEQNGDMIVNSAGSTLRMGTGVAGALRDAGGEQLNEAALLQGPAEVGDCIVTDAFELDAQFVAHAVSMPHYGTEKSTPDTIQESIHKALEAAEAKNCESVVLPMVGCGLGGVPLATGVRVIRDVLNSFSFNSVTHITLVAYSPEEHQVVKRICK